MGDKWSFRIKVGGDKDFKGMKSFSIQHPKTRSFLKEWIMHKIFKDENGKFDVSDAGTMINFLKSLNA